MKRSRTDIVLYRRGSGPGPDRLYRLAEVAGLAGIHPEAARFYLSLGLIEPEVERPEPLFSDDALWRLARLRRLRRDLGVNLASAGLVLDLLERIEEMERELDRLRGRP